MPTRKKTPLKPPPRSGLRHRHRHRPDNLAAGYCGESFVDDFLKRVGTVYPHPRVIEGRKRLWLRDDLDAAIVPENVGDIAEDL